MTNAIMLQAQNSFTLTDEMMNSLKELFGEKINVDYIKKFNYFPNGN